MPANKPPQSPAQMLWELYLAGWSAGLVLRMVELHLVVLQRQRKTHNNRQQIAALRRLEQRLLAENSYG